MANESYQDVLSAKRNAEVALKQWSIADHHDIELEEKLWTQYWEAKKRLNELCDALHWPEGYVSNL